MKRKIQTLLIVCAGLLGSGGCNDFFDRNPYDAMPSSKIWASDAYAKNAVNGLYAIANNGDAIPGYCYRFTCWGPDGYEYFRTNTMETGKLTVNDGLAGMFYSNYYTLIRAANEAIANLDGNTQLTPELRDQLLGEARFFRGFSYFILWQLYGDVILLDRPMDSDAVNRLAKSPADKIRDFAGEDFKAAASLLPPVRSAADNGRISGGAATAMLGKVYLYSEQWEDAAKEFEKLTKEPYAYKLHPTYGELFDSETEQNKEVVYALQFIEKTGFGSAMDIWYGSMSAQSSAGNYCLASNAVFEAYTHKDGTPIDISTRPKRNGYSDEVEFGKDLIAWYENLLKEDLDERLEANIIMPSALFVGLNDKTYKVYWPYSAYAGRQDEPLAFNSLWLEQYGVFCWRKFVNVGSAHTLAWQSPTDIPIIRYADVLLMYAEALNEWKGPNTTGVYSSVNEVRGRAGLDDLDEGLDKTQMRQAIRMERFREFPGEGQLFFDVRRWKTAATTDKVFGLNRKESDFCGTTIFERKFPEKYYHLPIPASELTINPNLEQNPDWL